MLALILLLTLPRISTCWQIVTELCGNTNISAGALPVDWCNANLSTRCAWTNITCNSASQLLGVELWNRPLNIPLMYNFDAPGPYVDTMKFVNCGLTGTFPAALASVTTLRQLDVSNNLLTGNLDWHVVAYLHYFSVANNRLSGKSGINALLANIPGAYDDLFHFDISRNSFQEQFVNLNELAYPTAVYLDFSHNLLYGTGFISRKAHVMRINNNYFSDVATYVPADAVVVNWTICDASNNPFVTTPPAWLLAIDPNACGYAYNPSNHNYGAPDFTPTVTASTQTPAPTTTLASIESTSAHTGTIATTDSTADASTTAASGSITTIGISNSASSASLRPMSLLTSLMSTLALHTETTPTQFPSVSFKLQTADAATLPTGMHAWLLCCLLVLFVR